MPPNPQVSPPLYAPTVYFLLIRKTDDISLRNQSDLVEEYHRQHPYLIIKEILHQFGVQCNGSTHILHEFINP